MCFRVPTTCDPFFPILDLVCFRILSNLVALLAHAVNNFGIYVSMLPYLLLHNGPFVCLSVCLSGTVLVLIWQPWSRCSNQMRSHYDNADNVARWKMQRTAKQIGHSTIVPSKFALPSYQLCFAFFVISQTERQTETEFKFGHSKIMY